jgi:hypothetical protein
MSKRNAVRTIAAATAALVLVAGVLALAAPQKPGAANRYGKWKMDSDNPPPSSNIMTYEPWGDGGMRVTVSTVSAKGTKGEWGYDTLFDGVFRPVRGQEGSETAVEFINDRSTRIQNKRNGRVTQIVINTLSEDLQTINNEYVRLDQEGKITGVTHAVYRRMK